MPYRIEREGEQFCVVKESSGERIHCHPTRADAEAQMAALYASEAKALKPRLLLLISTSAYQDKEREIIRQKALEEYVESCWDEETWKGMNAVDLWHGGDPIGDIVFADMEGPFLIEVARERPDAAINLARTGEAPLMTTVKAVWDGLEATDDPLGASPDFIHDRRDRQDGVYEWILKRRTAVLPRRAAANHTTFAMVLRQGDAHE